VSYGLRAIGSNGQAQITEDTACLTLVEESSVALYDRKILNNDVLLFYEIPVAADEIIAIKSTLIPAFFGPRINGKQRFFKNATNVVPLSFSNGTPLNTWTYNSSGDLAFRATHASLNYRKYKIGAPVNLEAYGLNVYGADGTLSWSSAAQIVSPKHLARLTLTFPSGSTGVNRLRINDAPEQSFVGGQFIPGNVPYAVSAQDYVFFTGEGPVIGFLVATSGTNTVGSFYNIDYLGFYNNSSPTLGQFKAGHQYPPGIIAGCFADNTGQYLQGGGWTPNTDSATHILYSGQYNYSPINLPTVPTMEGVMVFA
jgi:hypothetical protein